MSVPLSTPSQSAAIVERTTNVSHCIDINLNATNVSHCIDINLNATNVSHRIDININATNVSHCIDINIGHCIDTNINATNVSHHIDTNTNINASHCINATNTVSANINRSIAALCHRVLLLFLRRQRPWQVQSRWLDRVKRRSRSQPYG